MPEHLEVILHTLSPDSYNSTAAAEFMGETPVKFTRLNGVDEALNHFIHGEGDLAVLALKNSITGRVENHLRRTVRAVMRNGLYIVGHREVEVDHVLAVADSSVSIYDLSGVISHPAANEQTIDCRDGLGEELGRNLDSLQAPDTATAAEMIRDEANRALGAITSRKAAEANGLHILRERFYDGNDNHTTFWVFGRERINDCRANKTIVELETENHHGALRDALDALASSGISLDDLDHTQSNGNKHFILELIGGAHEDEVLQGLDLMRAASKEVYVLGSMRTIY